MRFTTNSDSKIIMTHIILLHIRIKDLVTSKATFIYTTIHHYIQHEHFAIVQSILNLEVIAFLWMKKYSFLEIDTQMKRYLHIIAAILGAGTQK